MSTLRRTPALDRLEELLAAKHPDAVVLGVDTTETTATARVRRRDGKVDVVHCGVEPLAPHRITETWVSGLVPDNVTPGLPADFADHEIAPTPEPTRLVVFSGVPGSGKSTLADAIGRTTGIPVFANDWLLGALTPFGGYHFDRLMDIGAELLTTLALRQLALGQSAVLDFPTEDGATRDRWRSLARRTGADFTAIVCVCPDREVHRQRVASRRRGIPGWHDSGDWDDISRRLDAFPPWPDALVVDTTRPHADNLAAVLARIGHH